MVDRSVVVRLIADNASFNSAMAQSANSVAGIGRQAEQTSNTTVAAFGRIKTAAIALIGIGAAKSGQELLILKENAQVAFETMYDSADKARAKIAEIEKFAGTTVIGLDKWIGGAQLLSAYGMEADKLVPILQSIADAAAASGQGAAVVDRIVLALGQIQSKGRVMAQEMLQLTEAGIPGWKMLAEALGVDIPTAMKMAERGMIDSKTALDALSAGIESRFGGTAQRAVDTLGGSFLSFKTALQQGGAAALKPLTALEEQAAKTGASFVKNLGAGVGDTLSGIGMALTPILVPLGMLASGFSQLPGPLMATAAALGVVALARGPLNNLWASTTSGFANMRRQMADNIAYQRTLAAGSVFNGQIVGQANRFQLAMGAIGTSLRGLRSAGSNIASALGGPVGIALIGATTLMAMWGNANRKAKEEAAANQAQLAALKDTLDSVSGAVTSATSRKMTDEWVADGTADKFAALGTSATEAAAAIMAGGEQLDAFKKKLAETLVANVDLGMQDNGMRRDVDPSFGLTREQITELVAAQMSGEEALTASYDRIAAASGMTAYDVSSAFQIMREEGVLADQGVTTIANSFGNNAVQIATGTEQIKEAFDAAARSAADFAGASGDDVVNALNAAKESGGSVEDALAGVGLNADETAKVIEFLGESVMVAGDGFHTIGGAARNVAAPALNEVTAAAQAAGKALQNAIADAQSFMSAASNSLTSFVDPAGAWDDAKAKANYKPPVGPKPKKQAVRDNPAVVQAREATKAGDKARDAAVKNAKSQQDATVKGAKAERDAVTKSAKAMKKAVDEQAKADQKLAKDAEDASQRRMTAAQKEAAELQKLADQKKKAAEDAKSILEDAEFRAEAAKVAVDAAKLGLQTSDPSNRAQWERIYRDAVKESKQAVKDLAKAQGESKSATEQSTTATQGAETATRNAEQADKDYQVAKDNTAAVTEDSSDRQAEAAEELQRVQEQAAEAFATAQEEAQARYTTAQEEAQARYEELMADKEAAEEAARKSTETYADDTTAAISGMVEDIEPSLAQWKRMLEGQKKDQENWVKNMGILAGKVPDDIYRYFIEAGPRLAGAAAEMVAGGPAKIKEMVPLIRASTDEWNVAIVQTLLAGIPGSDSALATLGQAGMTAMLAELNTADADVEAIFKKYGIIAQQTADQWGQVTWKFDVDPRAADESMRLWRERNGMVSGMSVRENVPTFSEGGWIRGGSGSRDDVPIIGMGGEFVVRKKAAQKNSRLLEYINAGGDGYDLPALSSLQSSPSGPAPVPAPSNSGPRTVIYATAHNPQAEATSLTILRGLSYAAAMDGLS